jgi:hypothetical protein
VTPRPAVNEVVGERETYILFRNLISRRACEPS